MFGLFKPARKGVVSRLAMAAALAGATVMGGTILATPVAAQDYTEAFVEAYQPVKEAFDNAADAAAAAPLRGQLAGVVAQVKTDDDKDAAGGLLVQAGAKLEDLALQRQGLEMRLESGKVGPDLAPMFNYYLGNFALRDGDYDVARTAFAAAIAGNFDDGDGDDLNDSTLYYAQSYFDEERYTEGLDYLKSAGELDKPHSESWHLNMLQAAYDTDNVDYALEWGGALVHAHDTAENWSKAIRVIDDLHQVSPQAELDMMRVLREAGTLEQRPYFVRYIEAADPRLMANEVEKVLAESVAAGQFSTSDEYYLDVKRVTDDRAPADREEAPEMVSLAQESGDAIDAMAAGDVHLSIEDYATAEAMYQLALANGADADVAFTRLGIAQVHLGKYAEAAANFANVSSDERKPLATLWKNYAEVKGGL
jgi:tetratricopeptide (TPR) repeat protein